MHALCAGKGVARASFVVHALHPVDWQRGDTPACVTAAANETAGDCVTDLHDVAISFILLLTYGVLTHHMMWTCQFSVSKLSCSKLLLITHGSGWF